MRRIVIATSVVGLALLVGADPAGAVLDPECSASADLLGDDGSAASVDASTTERVTIPRAADVNYRGSISIPQQDDMPYSGNVTLDVAAGLDLIPGLDDPTIGSWSWPDEEGATTDTVQTSGQTSYDLDLPLDLGGGLKATAQGSHTQAGVTCNGSLDVTIGGSAVNPASLAAGAVTAASAAGLGLAAVGKP